jgi:hypothetical protein
VSLDSDDGETDPETCGTSGYVMFNGSYDKYTHYHMPAFKIPCAMRKANGSYSPFSINSTTTLKDLQDDVGGKLGQHPNVMQLQYKLSSDKVNAPATSIQDDKELEIFTMRMRALIVPQCLANGKLSK